MVCVIKTWLSCLVYFAPSYLCQICKPRVIRPKEHRYRKQNHSVEGSYNKIIFYSGSIFTNLKCRLLFPLPLIESCSVDSLFSIYFMTKTAFLSRMPLKTSRSSFHQVSWKVSVPMLLLCILLNDTLFCNFFNDSSCCF